uniref:Uncharacterized protein n=1 Tax=Anguilla anguilla TaxID=7936 RepID=A0A0E9VPQ2_ANGAN
MHGTAQRFLYRNIQVPIGYITIILGNFTISLNVFFGNK